MTVDQELDLGEWEPEIEPAFFHFLQRIDQMLIEIIGIGRDDLPDQPYADWFAEEVEPKEAVDMILHEMGYIA